MLFGLFSDSVFERNNYYFVFVGIVAPIEAKVRKGKGAVGAYGNERTRQSLQDFPVVDSDEEEEKVQKVLDIFLEAEMSWLQYDCLIYLLRSFRRNWASGVKMQVLELRRNPSTPTEQWMSSRLRANWQGEVLLYLQESWHKSRYELNT